MGVEGVEGMLDGMDGGAGCRWAVLFWEGGELKCGRSGLRDWVGGRCGWMSLMCVCVRVCVYVCGSIRQLFIGYHDF